MNSVWDRPPYQGKTPSVGKFIEMINDPHSDILATLRALAVAMEDLDKK